MNARDSVILVAAPPVSFEHDLSPSTPFPDQPEAIQRHQCGVTPAALATLHPYRLHGVSWIQHSDRLEALIPDTFKILYVTSFASDMYHATGVHLIDSFLTNQKEDELLCCHEGQIEELNLLEHRLVRKYDLDTSAFLHSWLDTNKDIIPIALGGTAEPCSCPTPDNPHAQHARRCPYSWFNKGASRWFRKIVSLEAAMTTQADAIVWIDSDCRFKKSLPASVWSSHFEDYAALYHKSPDRSVIESGVLAFRMSPSGKALLSLVVDRYRSGAFRNEERWDDGYIFQKVFEGHPELPSKDLAVSSLMFDYVLPSSPIGSYIDHYKGVHGGVLRLMR